MSANEQEQTITADEGEPITSSWLALDLPAVAVVLCLVIVAAVVHAMMAAPRVVSFSELGLRFERPAGWLPGQDVPDQPAKLAGALSRGFVLDVETPLAPPEAAPAEDPATRYHRVYQSPLDPLVRIEVEIVSTGQYSNIRTARQLERLARYGDTYWGYPSSSLRRKGDDQVGDDKRNIGKRDWIRSEYRYAFRHSDHDSPKIADAVEYSTVVGGLTYSVTVHGGEHEISRLESVLAPTLAVDVGGQP